MTTKIRIDNTSPPEGRTVRATLIPVAIAADGAVVQAGPEHDAVYVTPGNFVEVWLHAGQSVRVDEI